MTNADTIATPAEAPQPETVPNAADPVAAPQPSVSEPPASVDPNAPLASEPMTTPPLSLNDRLALIENRLAVLETRPEPAADIGGGLISFIIDRYFAAERRQYDAENG